MRGHQQIHIQDVWRPLHNVGHSRTLRKKEDGATRKEPKAGDLEAAVRTIDPLEPAKAWP